MLERIFQHRVLTHVLYWTGILIAYPIYAKGFGEPMYESFIYKLSFLPGQILASYLIIYFQIPVLIYQKRIGLFFLSCVFSIYLFPVMAHLADDYVIAEILALDSHVQHSVVEILSTPILVYYQITAFVIPFITAAIKLVKQNLEEKQEINILEGEKAAAELRLLKAKIHPHFLFNTLDYLYKLSIQQSDLAPEIVIKLSEMLDYSLYHTQDQQASLQKEIRLLEHYLDLQASQYGEIFVYHFERNLEEESLEVEPLLLLAMLESILMSYPPSEKETLLLDLSLTSGAHQIQFCISVETEGSMDIHPTTDSLRKQLSLAYPNRHVLDSHYANKRYSLELTLEIES